MRVAPLDLPLFRIRDLTERYSNSNVLKMADDLNNELERHLHESYGERRRRERQVRANIHERDSLLYHEKPFWLEELDGVARSYSYRRVLQ
jgi:hypothetical protein